MAGRLHFTSDDPAGYALLVDGEEVCRGQPPFAFGVSELDPGRHALTVRCNTFPDLEDEAVLFVCETALTPDADLDGDTDADDEAARDALGDAPGWTMPAAPGALRRVRLSTYAPASGRVSLTLAGDSVFRVWRNGSPLIGLGGGTVENGDVVSLPAEGDSDIFVEAVTNGSAVLVYAFYDGVTACEDQIRMTAYTLAVDVSSEKLGASPNPPPFAWQETHVFRPDKSPDPDQHAVVLYKDAVNDDFTVKDFDVALTARPEPSAALDSATLRWEKLSGPDSGELLNASSLSAVYRNPKKGGVYRFRLTVKSGDTEQSFCEANLVLPLAGAEMDDVIKANLQQANAFVSRIASKYTVRDRRKIKQLTKWFIDWNSGDYVGRPDNRESPSVWYYGQVSSQTDSKYRLGAVCTWKGRPVRMSKLTDFLVGYTIQKLGVNYYIAKTGVLSGFGTGDGPTASASWDAGWNLSEKGTSYDTVVSSLVDYIWTNEEESDKTKKPWPNPNPPDNYGGLSIYDGFDFNRTYAVPWFLFRE